MDVTGTTGADREIKQGKVGQSDDNFPGARIIRSTILSVECCSSCFNCITPNGINLTRNDLCFQFMHSCCHNSSQLIRFLIVDRRFTVKADLNVRSLDVGCLHN